MLEKPLGTDLESSREINADVARHFRENQIYRIDHYLGKESLQNLLPLRFANVFFEPVWNRDYIKSVQITIAETLGVEERGEFYDATGALRDMVQNHIVQMLCFTAMERPKSLSAVDIRDEKLKVIAALKPLSAADVARYTVRGQYAASGSLKGYMQEHKVPAGSRTETYAAIRAEIDTPRWAYRLTCAPANACRAAPPKSCLISKGSLNTPPCSAAAQTASSSPCSPTKPCASKCS